MGDLRAALRAHPGLRTAGWVVLILLVGMAALHALGYGYGASGGGGSHRGTFSLGHLHLSGLGNLHAHASANNSGGAPFARTAPAVQDTIGGGEGSMKDEPFSGVVIPLAPSALPGMPYPADYAAVDD